MIEYGLSVSLNGTPRTPMTPMTHREDSSLTINDEVCGGGRHAPRKMMKYDVYGGNDSSDSDDSSGIESISPRVLFRCDGDDGVSRRLDFSSLPLSSSELSPVSFASASMSIPQNHSGGSAEGRHVEAKSVGDCAVCYDPLQERTNHVFTACNHLFCLRCLLKWWDTSTTCPLCRAELFQAEDEEEAAAGAGGAAVGVGGVVGVGAVAGGHDAWIQPPQEINDESVEEEYNNDIQQQAPWWDNDSDSEGGGEGGEGGDGGEGGHGGDGGGDNINIANATLLNRYIYQDTNWLWSFYRGSQETDPNYDDRVYQLSQAEIHGLRENREIAINLFARMRFRETLFHNAIQFLGEVWLGEWVPKYDWIDIMHYQRYLSSIHSVMYEIVIRRGSAISPIYEVSIFGFIKDVTIRQTVEYAAGEEEEELGNDGGDDSRWENTVEYAFIAEVFTPTDFNIHDVLADDPTHYRSYGGYDMTEGTITTQEVAISFSQIRRMYRMNGRQRAEA